MPKIYILLCLLSLISEAKAKQWTWTMPEVQPKNTAEASSSAPKSLPEPAVSPTLSSQPDITALLQNPAEATALMEELQKYLPDNMPVSGAPSLSGTAIPNDMMMPMETPSLDMEKQDFDEIDTDGDGYLDETELLNFQQRKLDKIAEETFKTLDTNRDNRISPEEMEIYYRRFNQDGKYTDSIQERFQLADIDENKYLDSGELKHFLQKDLLNNNNQIFTLMDTDGDKKVSRREYDEIMEFFGKFF